MTLSGLSFSPNDIRHAPRKVPRRRECSSIQKLEKEQQKLKQLHAGKKQLEMLETHRLQRDQLVAKQNEELRRLSGNSQNVEEGDEDSDSGKDSMWM